MKYDVKSRKAEEFINHEEIEKMQRYDRGLRQPKRRGIELPPTNQALSLGRRRRRRPLFVLTNCSQKVYNKFTIKANTQQILNVNKL